MHRHGYKGRKLHRERDQREALVQGLADSLIIYESIETTHAKAKEVVPYLEKLITRAKKADLHSRRIIISRLQTKGAAHKLIDEVAPKLSGRSSGHLRIVKTRQRKGDNAQLARISFVDDFSSAATSNQETKRVSNAKPTAKKVVAATSRANKKAAAPKPKEAAKS